METLKILSFNANGLGDYRKRKDVLDYLRNLKADLIFLQEVHVKSASENMFRSMWGFECFVNGKDSNSKGVAILLNNTFEYKVHEIIKDDNGTYILLDMNLLGKRMTLVNVYGPSGTDSPHFFENVCNLIENVGNDYVIVGGDWNVVQDVSKDVFRYRCVGRPRARRQIVDMMVVLDLVDVWRELHPDKRQYTWRRFNTVQQGRLDYFLVSAQLVSDITDSSILPGYRSDHSIISLSLQKGKMKRQRPMWKFPNNLLKDREFVKEIKDLILEIKRQYGALVYCQESIGKIRNEELQLMIDDQLFFEMILLEIRGKSIVFSADKKRIQKEREETLVKEIAELEKDLDENNLELLKDKREELEAIRKKKVEGMIVRSRAKWIQEGETNSKYFSNLEKRNYVEKSIPYIEKEDGTLISDIDEIRREVKDFYENLYASKENEIIDVDLPSVVDGPKLTQEQSDSVEGEISVGEALSALKKMKNNKSPGGDGYTTEFFKFFWTDIGVFLVRSINFGFRTGQMSLSQRQGVITCIPKEGKPKKFLKNLRPITLLNTAYKIASACIAERLKSVLPEIIHEDQKGFLPGRFIGENLRMLYDILFYTDANNIPGLLLLIDFEKAFDSVSWSFMQKCLDYFNFGPNMKHWIKTFYNNVYSCVAVNGGYSERFSVYRGCRQGDPCSPYLYLICAEILSLLIRSNPDIKGINIADDVKALLSQFADDTTLFLNGSKRSFEEAITTINYFSSMSGLKMNSDKTQVIWIGSRKNSGERFRPDLNFIWNSVKFKVLGVYFSTEIDNIVTYNYEGKLEEVRRLLLVWSRRHLTPIGKITVLKTFALSKFVYLFSNIPDPPAQFFKDLDKMFFDFLWSKKGSKVKRSVMCSLPEEGGLRMIDVAGFAASMKISWLRRIGYGESTFRRMLLSMCPLLKNLFSLGGEYANIIMRRFRNSFWCDVMKHYKKLCVKCTPEGEVDFLSENIHYNIHVRRDHKTVHVKEWIDNNILRIGDLVNEQGAFYTFDEFQVHYPAVNTNFLTYIGIVNALRYYKGTLDVSTTGNSVNDFSKVWTSIIYGGNKVVYNIFIKVNDPPSCIEKWNTYCSYPLNWKQIFVKAGKTTSDVNLKWFQFRLLHRIISTQRYLFLIKIADSAMCTFCASEEETITHLFWNCPFVQRFWADVLQWIYEECQHCLNFSFSESLILFGWKENCKTDKVMDLIILLGKYHIHKSKLQNRIPNCTSFKNIVRDRYCIERYAHAIAGLNEKFISNWLPYLRLLDP